MKNGNTYITTSWDDGNPSDLRVAELLVKHGLRGTFYVPRSAKTGTMTAAQIRDLGSVFEIGAHTLHHVVLTGMMKEKAWREISDSKSWLEDTIGHSCRMFCPPSGEFSKEHVCMIQSAGFIGLRTTELGSLDHPRKQTGFALMPTTLQAYPHGLVAVARNAAKRFAFGNLWRLIANGRAAEWPILARSLLHRVLDDGGVFHLWGHSWELGVANQWTHLDDVLQAMEEIRANVPSLDNGEIAHRCLSSARGGGVCLLRGEERQASTIDLLARYPGWALPSRTDAVQCSSLRASSAKEPNEAGRTRESRHDPETGS